jgi:hypothetical protein
MSNLPERIAAAIFEIGRHCDQHGRDMNGDTLGLRDAQAVLREAARELKKAEPPPEPPKPEPAAPEPEAAKPEPVRPQAAVRAKGQAGG